MHPARLVGVILLAMVSLVIVIAVVVAQLTRPTFDDGLSMLLLGVIVGLLLGSFVALIVWTRSLD